jgi:hypothetical protein
MGNDWLEEPLALVGLGFCFDRYKKSAKFHREENLRIIDIKQLGFVSIEEGKRRFRQTMPNRSYPVVDKELNCLDDNVIYFSLGGSVLMLAYHDGDSFVRVYMGSIDAKSKKQLIQKPRTLG